MAILIHNQQVKAEARHGGSGSFEDLRSKRKESTLAYPVRLASRRVQTDGQRRSMP